MLSRSLFPGFLVGRNTIYLVLGGHTLFVVCSDLPVTRCLVDTFLCILWLSDSLLFTLGRGDAVPEQHKLLYPVSDLVENRW